MTEHKKLTRVYGANLCTFCGRAWEDGEEIPDCVAPQEEAQKTRKKFFRAYFPAPTHFTAWLLYGNNGKAMVAYAVLLDEKQKRYCKGRRIGGANPFCCLAIRTLY
ncbi:hypothetical protein [Salmonella phage SD-12_S18]|nr:hypothetical protein [Salmonella phage SD-12_S18]